MLTIKNMRWTYKEFTDMSNLINVFGSRLKELNLTTEVIIDGKSILFRDVEEGKTFTSAVENKVMLKLGDERIDKVKRNYLLTKRPTEKQYKGFFDIIQNTLDQLGLSADVDLIIKKTGTTIPLRKGKVVLKDAYPAMKSYPSDMKEGVANGT